MPSKHAKYTEEEKARLREHLREAIADSGADPCLGATLSGKEFVEFEDLVFEEVEIEQIKTILEGK